MVSASLLLLLELPRGQEVQGTCPAGATNAAVVCSLLNACTDQLERAFTVCFHLLPSSAETEPWQPVLQMFELSPSTTSPFTLCMQWGVEKPPSPYDLFLLASCPFL